MSTAVSVESRIERVEVTDETITAYLVDGRVISVPLAWSWRLSEATPAQRANWRLIGDGDGVHWPEVDEDISAEGMLNGIPAHRPKATAEFEHLWSEMKADATGSFEYANPDSSFCRAVDEHFRTVSQLPRFGVYVVRRIEDAEVVYIGKGGTITTDGLFKRQDIRGRLKAVRRRDTSSDRWFASACTECRGLRVEYVFLSATPVSPGLAEAKLLQAFLNDLGRLPRYNKGL